LDPCKHLLRGHESAEQSEHRMAHRRFRFRVSGHSHYLLCRGRGKRTCIWNRDSEETLNGKAQQGHARDVRRRTRVMADVGPYIAKNEMSQEWNPCLQVRRNHHGAKSMVGVRCGAVFTNASWFASGLSGAANVSPASGCSRVASFRAKLRSSVPEIRNVRCSGVSPCAVHPRIAVRSGSAMPVAIVVSLRSASVPNNTLVPTTQRYAPLCSHGASAAVSAQRGRWIPRE
jgi:hypothetical protein